MEMLMFALPAIVAVLIPFAVLMARYRRSDRYLTPKRRARWERRFIREKVLDGPTDQALVDELTRNWLAQETAQSQYQNTGLLIALLVNTTIILIFWPITRPPTGYLISWPLPFVALSFALFTCGITAGILAFTNRQLHAAGLMVNPTEREENDTPQIHWYTDGGMSQSALAIGILVVFMGYLIFQPSIILQGASTSALWIYWITILAALASIVLSLLDRKLIQTQSFPALSHDLEIARRAASHWIALRTIGLEAMPMLALMFLIISFQGIGAVFLILTILFVFGWPLAEFLPALLPKRKMNATGQTGNANEDADSSPA